MPDEGTSDRPRTEGTPLQQFWRAGADSDTIKVQIAPAEKSLELLERLGPSPFDRGGFPLVGFLATTYDKVARYALPSG